MNKNGSSNTTSPPHPSFSRWDSFGAAEVVPIYRDLGAKRLHFTEIPPDTSGSGMTARNGDIYVELTL